MRFVEAVTRDVRHAARALRRSPGFSLAVMLTLALGIGSNTAVFSVVNQLLLRPLPYPDGDQLVLVDEWSIDRRARADVSPGKTGSTGSVRAARSGDSPPGGSRPSR